MKKIVLIRRYDADHVDQDFMDLEFARLDHENKMQDELEKDG